MKNPKFRYYRISHSNSWRKSSQIRNSLFETRSGPQLTEKCRMLDEIHVFLEIGPYYSVGLPGDCLDRYFYILDNHTESHKKSRPKNIFSKFRKVFRKNIFWKFLENFPKLFENQKTYWFVNWKIVMSCRSPHLSCATCIHKKLCIKNYAYKKSMHKKTMQEINAFWLIFCIVFLSQGYGV